MKKLFIIGLALLGLETAKAQSVLLINAVSNAPTASVTNSTKVDCQRQSTVGVQITQTTASAGGLAAGHMLYYFYRSMDGSTLDSAPQIVGSPAQTGLSQTFTTNLTSAGANFFTCVSTNTLGTTGVVVTARYAIKIGTAQ